MNLFLTLHRNIQIRVITTFLIRMVGGMIWPFMTIYFTDHFGASTTGILMMISVAVSVVVSFYGGYLTDTLGRKQVMVIGQMLSCATFFFMTMANSPWLSSAWLTFVMFTLNSAANSLSNPAAEAMLIDVSTAETRAFIYSINYWALNAGVMVGGMIGGLFYTHHRFELYVSLTIISLLNLYLISAYLVDTYQPTKRAIKVNTFRHVVDSYRAVFVDKAYMLLSIATIFIFSLEFQRTNYISVHIHETFHSFQLASFTIDSIRAISLIAIENTLLIVVFTLFIARFVGGRNQRLFLYVGIILQAIGFGMLGYSTTLLFLIFFCFLQTIGEMIYVPVSQTFRASLMDDHARGSYSAVSGLVFQICKLLGALGITLGAILGATGMLIAMLAFGAISCLVYTISWRIAQKRGKVTPEPTITP